MANCSGLERFSDFDTYIEVVRDRTKFDEAALIQCQQQICLAIWGEGNPDISGIGVSVGYVIEVVLAFLLAAAVLAVQARETRPRWCRSLDEVLCAAFAAFFDCAVFFALAVELASLVMLAQKDLFNVPTNEFGANDVRIATANSVVCLLPLLYPLAVHWTHRVDAGEGHDQEHQEQRPRQCNRCAEGDKRDIRLSLFYLLIPLHFVPFLFQCTYNWGPSRIGSSPTADGSVIATEAEWNAVLRICFGDVRQFSNAEMYIIAVFEILGSLIVFAFALWHSVATVVLYLDGRGKTMMGKWIALIKWRLRERNFWLTIMLLLTPLGLSVPLRRGIFRLRDIQGKLAERMGSQYTGNEWGFGQIIGLVIFAPVFTEALWAWRHRCIRGNGIRAVAEIGLDNTVSRD